MTATCFETRIPDVGDFALRPLDPAADGALLHAWVTRPSASFWNMGDKSRAEVEAFYRDLNASGHAMAYLGLVDGASAFLLESYDPAHDQIADHYAVAPGDRGMHFLVGPATRPIHGFTTGVFRTIMDFLFSDAAVRRIVVEPDVRNARIHVLNEKIGFVTDREIQLREKRAKLGFCTRDRYFALLDRELA